MKQSTTGSISTGDALFQRRPFSIGNEGIFDVLTSTAERTLVREDYVYSVGTGSSILLPGNSDFTAVLQILPLFRSDFEGQDLP